jgi:hypothetical protein
MLLDPRPAARPSAVWTGWLPILIAAAAWQGSAQAQGKLEARYGITFARISVGSVSMTADLKESDYTVEMTGRAGGVVRMLVNGEASMRARGDIKDGRPEPRSFTSEIRSEGESQSVTMAIEEGNVAELAVTPPLGDPSLLVPEADRRGIVDPLTAMLVPAEAATADLSQDACRHTFAIFDGRHRYDLKLTFKRMDKVSAEKGYAGPAVVCGLSFQPIAGHRASDALVKYLSEGREMELVLAPVAGTRVLAPFGLSIPSALANLVIWASRFEAAAPSPIAPGPD